MYRRPMSTVQRRVLVEKKKELARKVAQNLKIPHTPTYGRGKYVAKTVPREVFNYNGYGHIWPEHEFREELDFKIRFGKPLKNNGISKNTKEFSVKEFSEEYSPEPPDHRDIVLELCLPKGKSGLAELRSGYFHFRGMRSEKVASEIIWDCKCTIQAREIRLSDRYEAELKNRRKIEEMFTQGKCHFAGREVQCKNCCHQKKDNQPCSLKQMAEAKEIPDIAARIKKQLEKERYLPDMIKKHLAQMHDWKAFKHALRAIKEGFYATARVATGGSSDGRITDFRLMVINPDKNYNTIITNAKGKNVSARTLTYSVAKLDKLKELPAFILPVKTRANALRKRRRSTRIYFVDGSDDATD